MNPSGSAAPGLDTSNMATLLLSALATSSLVSSGERLT
jgi:hypothetical protein